MLDQDVRVSPVCKHHQTGYCKYGNQCHKHHNDKICNDRVCRDQNCTARHPKTCKFFARKNQCKLNEKCAYSHHKVKDKKWIQNLENEIKILKEEIVKLSKHTQEMATKLEMIQYNEKDETKKQQNQNSTNKSDMIVNQKQDYTKSSESEHKKAEQMYFRCDQCEFICKTDTSLRKHINTKHPASHKVL